MRRLRLLGGAIAILLLAASCSGGDESSPAEAEADQATEQASTDGGGAETEAGGAQAGSSDAEGGATVVVEADGSAPVADSDGAAQTDTTTAAITEAVGTVIAETGEGLSGADLEQYLARRYEAYWQAFDLARQAPAEDPRTGYPELATLAAGEQLEATYNELADLFGSGHAIREPATPAVPGLDANTAHRVRIDLLDEGVAELTSCLVNDQVRVDTASGEILNERIITVQTKTTMAKADGTWKVIRSQATDLDEGVAGCWLDPESSFPL